MAWLIGLGVSLVLGCVALLLWNFRTHRQLRAFERSIGVRH